MNKTNHPMFHDGDARKGREARLYIIWSNMKSRCFTETNANFSRYGGRGITVCNDWLYYLTFKEWALTHGYNDSLTLDRINNNGNYCPENCQWISLVANVKKKARKIQRDDGKIYANRDEVVKELGCYDDSVNLACRKRSSLYGHYYFYCQ